MRTAASALLCAGIGAAPAAALSPVTYVSGKGSDSGACATPAAACRTFAYALSQTNAGGAITALDPADYRPVTIDKSISIVGVVGAGIVRGAAGDAIYVVAGASDVVALSHLTLDGFRRAATFGVRVEVAGLVTIKKCAMRNFSQAGVALVSANAVKFLIEDTAMSNNGTGFSARNNALDGVLTGGALRRVSLTDGNFGAHLDFGATAALVDSVVAHNLQLGLLVGRGRLALGGVVAQAAPTPPSELHISHSTVIANGSYGVAVVGAGAAFSAGDNFFAGNQFDVQGPWTPVGQR